MPLGIYLFSEVIRKVKSWMIYEKIQEMKRNKLNKSQVSRHLGIDYKTVMKYWDMPSDGFAEKQIQAMQKSMKQQKRYWQKYSRSKKNTQYRYPNTVL